LAAIAIIEERAHGAVQGHATGIHGDAAGTSGACPDRCSKLCRSRSPSPERQRGRRWMHTILLHRGIVHIQVSVV
jgi:hypothetical protein